MYSTSSGHSASQAPQVALGPRLRLPISRRWALTAGAGWSAGRYGTIELCLFGPPCAPEWRGTIQWLNLEAGLEFQHDRGFTLRVFGGRGFPLNPDGLRCIDDPWGSNEPCAGRPVERVAPFPSIGVAVAAVVLFLCYLRLSGTIPANADGSDQALQAWDMLHGNWLLSGWTVIVHAPQPGEHGGTIWARRAD